MESAMPPATILNASTVIKITHTQFENLKNEEKHK